MSAAARVKHRAHEQTYLVHVSLATHNQWQLLIRKACIVVVCLFQAGGKGERRSKRALQPRIQPLTRRTQACGDHRSCRFPVRTSKASVAVRKQRVEQRETLEQSERSQANRVGNDSWDQTSIQNGPGANASSLHAELVTYVHAGSVLSKLSLAFYLLLA